MKKTSWLAVLGVFSSALAGCSSSRDVAVTGEVAAAQGAGVQGKTLIDFRDVVDGKSPESAATTTLDALGPFTATAPLEGDQVLVRAINDRDSNGACTEGEAWAEVVAPITDDEVEGVSLTVAVAACPPADE